MCCCGVDLTSITAFIDMWTIWYSLEAWHCKHTSCKRLARVDMICKVPLSNDICLLNCISEQEIGGNIIPHIFGLGNSACFVPFWMTFFAYNKCCCVNEDTSNCQCTELSTSSQHFFSSLRIYYLSNEFCISPGKICCEPVQALISALFQSISPSHHS